MPAGRSWAESALLLPCDRSTARTHVRTRSGRKGLADAAGRGFAPEVFQPVVLACVGREDVHDHVPVVEQDPAGLAVALDAARQEAAVGVVLQLVVDSVVNRLRLALRVPRADHEEVGVGDDAAQVDDADVDCLLVGGDLSDPFGQRGRVRGGRLGRGQVGTASFALPCPAYRPLSSMYPATLSGTRYRIGAPSRTRCRTAEDDTCISGMSR